MKRDKECHLILIEVAIHQEKKTILNIYAVKASAPNFTKQNLLEIKAQKNPNTVITCDFSTQITLKDMSSIQKEIKKLRIK
jgi:predicted ferric reductase